jgi:ferredoxin-NADP reductase/Na+-translocating ferredoxin:NAD+ oxidoreductase RnfD subunit
MWQQLIKPIDKLIDGISMYRLILYYLLGILIAAVGLSAVGDLHYSPIQIIISAVTLVLACWILNKVFAYIFQAPVNSESSILTGLILALIIPPTLGQFGFLFLLAAAGLAIASKYILTIGEKHIFNPAAIAVVLTAFGPRQNASWWVGTAVLLPFVMIGGVLITRKVRREYMLGSFLFVTTVTTGVLAVLTKASLSTSLHNMALSSPVFFLGFVMLTEPYTSPTTKQKQIWYATIVGLLLAPQIHLGNFYASPEIALIVGNIFAYIVSSKTKLFPVFQQQSKLTADSLEFAFTSDRKLAYQPGQYMEWTIPHNKTDSRGSRRWFTLASSPTEKYIRLGIKVCNNGSSYKRAMLHLNENSALVAAQVAGDFVMPKDINKKLVFIAGGIGVTPFRSMIKYLLDTGEQRSVRMLYSARTPADFAYRDIFEQARQSLGIQTTYIVSDMDTAITVQQPHTIAGRLNVNSIKQLIPDYNDCEFYISGTHLMVKALQISLHELGVSRNHIKVDFFPGYV